MALGLKSLRCDSDGGQVPAQKFYQNMQDKLATAQRAGKSHRVRAIHAKIANRRKDYLHKLATRQVREHAAIFVGNVHAAGLAKTNPRLAKSVWRRRGQPTI
ncbi:MAG: transposase [Burkholderiaceae bacterium]|nr:transposase [Burkholderiaceae bacterium]